jgi:hypothetical protein
MEDRVKIFTESLVQIRIVTVSLDKVDPSWIEPTGLAWIPRKTRDFSSLIQEIFYQVAADKPGRARDQGFHAAPVSLPVDKNTPLGVCLF